MRVGVMGPGVIGSVIGGRLAAAGHDVTLIARGQRLAQLDQAGGLLLAHEGVSQTVDVHVAGDLRAEEPFDWLFVCVRADQATAALEQIAADDQSPNVITMINHARGVDAWLDVVGRRLCCGFPGIFGHIDDGRVHYDLANRRMQPTTLGEPDGTHSERIVSLAAALERAGIPTKVHDDIDAWLRFHVAWIHILALGVVNAGGSLETLLSDAVLRGQMVEAMRESISVVESLGLEPTPSMVKWLRRVPRPVLSSVLRAALGAPSFRQFFERAGEGQRLENRELTLQMRELAARSAVESPAHAALAERLELGD